MALNPALHAHWHPGPLMVVFPGVGGHGMHEVSVKREPLEKWYPVAQVNDAFHGEQSEELLVRWKKPFLHCWHTPPVSSYPGGHRQLGLVLLPHTVLGMK